MLNILRSKRMKERLEEQFLAKSFFGGNYEK